MTKERYKFISAVHLILRKEGKVLLLRRFNTGYEDGNYSVPAGHIDQGERARTAMVRETKEEVGLDLSEDALKTVHVMHRMGNDQERIDFFMAADTWNGEPLICETNKCDDLSWHVLSQLPDNMIPYVKSAMEHISRNEFYSEFDWNRGWNIWQQRVWGSAFQIERFVMDNDRHSLDSWGMELAASPKSRIHFSVNSRGSQLYRFRSCETSHTRKR